MQKVKKKPFIKNKETSSLDNRINQKVVVPRWLGIISHTGYKKKRFLREFMLNIKTRKLMLLRSQEHKYDY